MRRVRSRIGSSARAAQDDAEQRRGQASQTDDRFGGRRGPLAREAHQQRARRLAPDDHGEHHRHLLRVGLAAAGDGHLADLERPPDVRVLLQRVAHPADVDLLAVGDQVDEVGIDQQREQADRIGAQRDGDVLGGRVQLALPGADRQHLRRLGQDVQRRPVLIGHRRAFRVDSQARAAAAAAATTSRTGTRARAASRRQSSNSGWAPSTSPSRAASFARTAP